MEQGTPPINYTIVTTTCLEQNEMIITPTDPGGSGGGGIYTPPNSGGGNNPPCTGTTIPTNPQPGFTDENGCPIGAPSQPNFPPKIANPCEKLKAQSTNAEFSNRMSTLKDSLNLKREIGYIEKTDGTFDFKNTSSSGENANTLTLGSILPTTKGYIHTHPNDYEDATGAMRKGFKIFSPADVIYFMSMVANAQQNNIPLLDIYSVMIASKNGQILKYQIRFTGNVNQIKTTFANTNSEFRKMYLKYFDENKKRSDELNFFKFIDENMYIKGVTLVKMNQNGTFTKKTLSADKTQVIDEDCPQ